MWIGRYTIIRILNAFVLTNFVIMLLIALLVLFPYEKFAHPFRPPVTPTDLMAGAFMVATGNCFKCDTHHVKVLDENLDDLDLYMVEFFLCTFDTSCKRNVEYSEYSNETLFMLLSKRPDLFFEVLKRTSFYNLELFIETIENPVHDNINFQDVYEHVKAVDAKSEIKSRILTAILHAPRKENQQIKE